MHFNNNFSIHKKKTQSLISIVPFLKIKLIAIFFCLVFTAICSSLTYSQSLFKIRIDPNTSRGGNASDFFEQVEYIPLETNKNSLFGEASELIITDKSFVVYDFDTKSVLFFDRAGKFLRKKVFNKDASIGMSYMKDAKTVIVVICLSGKTIYEAACFSDLGEEKKSISVSNIKELEDGGKLVSLEKGFYAVGGNCYLASSEKPKLDTTYLISVYNDNHLYKNFIPVTQTSQTAICMLRSYISLGDFNSNGTVYASTPLNHTVYKISKDSAIPAFQFVFPTSRVLPKYILEGKDPKQIDSVKRRLQSDQNIILSVNNIFYHKSKLFFKLNPRVYISSAGSSSKNQYNFIYDTLNRNLFSLERILTDKISYHLPLFDQSVKVSGLKYFDGSVFTTISSLTTFAGKEKSASVGQVKYPAILEKYFETQNRKSNPVIVRMKLKE